MGKRKGDEEEIPRGELPYMGCIGMWRCEGYGKQFTLG